jgi:hypothetical protein
LEASMGYTGREGRRKGKRDGWRAEGKEETN